MGAYLIRRLLHSIPIFILVTVSVFMLLYLTGDPTLALTGTEGTLDPEQLAYLRHELGFDRPMYVQYATWLGRVVRGDFGRSSLTKRPVITEIKERLPATIQLGLASWLFSIFIAIPVGIIASTRRGSKLDIFTTVTTIGGVAIPSFWLGMMLILLFAVKLRWLPACGFVSLFDNPIQGLSQLVRPAFSQGLHVAAVDMRQTRSAMLRVLAQDYIRTARAKGLAERNVILVHAIKNAALPVITIMGLQIGRLLGGQVVIENLFAIPGMGRLMVNSILYRDFPVVQACVLIVAIAIVLANLATDLLYGYLDPRIRYD